MDKLKKKVLYSRQEIQERVRQMASAISEDYRGRELVVVGVLKGAFIFMADLTRYLDLSCKVDFLRAASYGSGSMSSGEVVITKDLEIDIEGKDVLLVEDIIDTGITLRFLAEKLKERKPRSLKVCAFIDKKLRRKVAFDADYVGFTMDDAFLVGYGLDYNEMGRVCPDICEIEL
jgi:hypoxanthine phosphoribosyltransferase